MKHVYPLWAPLCAILLSCGSAELCENQDNAIVHDISGVFRFDERFDRYAVDSFINGSIDSRRIYVICDESQIENPEKWVGSEVIIGGQAHALNESLIPTQVVAGEEFFVIGSIEQFSGIAIQH